MELQELLAGIKAQREAEEETREGTEEELVARRPNIIHQIQFLLSPSILKPFCIGHMFNIFHIFAGTWLVIFYAVDMISETQGNIIGLDSFTVAQLTGFVRLVFTLVANWMLYFVPRRTHAIASSSICACAALTLSCFLFIQLKTHSIPPESNMWITPTLILVFIAADSCAFLALPSTIMSELLPTKIRGAASGYIYSVNDVLQFCLSKTYPWLKGALGIHGVFLMFGVNALLCSLFCYFFLPETQGKSLPQIEEYFRNSTLFWIKRDRRSDRCNTTQVYIEMKSTDTTGSVTTYGEQDDNKLTEDTHKKTTRKLSVTFHETTEKHCIL